MTATYNAVKIKMALLELAKELGNVSKACKLLGYSRDSYYRIRDLYEKGGEAALEDKPRTKPNVKNRVPSDVENQLLQLSLMEPRWGQVQMARALRRRGLKISPSGVRGIWLRHNLETLEKRSRALEPTRPIETGNETAVIEPCDVDN